MRAARVRSFWRTRWDVAGLAGLPLASFCPAGGVMAHEATARAGSIRKLARVYPREARGAVRIAPPARGRTGTAIGAARTVPVTSQRSSYARRNRHRRRIPGDQRRNGGRLLADGNLVDPADPGWVHPRHVLPD